MGSLWMLIAAFLFAAMGACVKLASAHYSTSEIVMYRGAIGVLILMVLTRVRGGSFATLLIRQHVWRALTGVASLWLWFFAIGELPLATAMTFNYVAPVWLALIVLMSGHRAPRKRIEWPLLLAIAASFVGIVLVLRPSFSAEQWLGTAVGLFSGMLAAFAYLHVRTLGKLGEQAYRIVFYFSLGSFVTGLLGCLAEYTVANTQVWHGHSTRGVALLAAIGVCATGAQLAMTRAYRIGKTLVVANLHYSGLIFSCIWAMLIWGDHFDASIWIGMGIITVSGIGATFYNTRSSAPAASGRAAPTDPIASEL